MIRVQAWSEFVMKWVCFLKFYSPLAIWPWLRIRPHSSLNVIYYLIITARQWLMSFMDMPCIPVQINPVKARWGTGSWPFSFESSATFPPQADQVLVNLFSSLGAGGALQAEPPHIVQKIFLCHSWCLQESYEFCQISYWLFIIFNLNKTIFRMSNLLLNNYNFSSIIKVVSSLNAGI